MKPLTIVVGGYIVGFPFGGMTWHHLNYLAGLHDLGHEIWFLEDSDQWYVPYNPIKHVCEPDSAYGRRYLEESLDFAGLPRRWCYYSDFEKKYYGLDEAQLNDLLKRADLLLYVSGITPWRNNRPRPRRTAVIDTDPVFTQLRMNHDAGFAQYFHLFDSVATFGTLIGTPACPLPTHGINWIPTRQPICLRCWPATPTSSKIFTTLGKWEHSERTVELNGVRYRSSKGPEWMKMLTLPGKVPWTMQLAMQTVPPNVRCEFEAQKWQFIEPLGPSISAAAFGDFVRNSAGEFTVAKEIYAGVPSGWFSDRGAAFLASGRPVVTQPSGFQRQLPTGEGLFAVNTVDEAANALNAIAADYPRHSAAARAIAKEFFDSRKVLRELLEFVM